MSEFTSDFWGIYVGLITVVSIVACAVLLQSMSTRRVAKDEPVGTTGHTWDEDLTEWNNPLPRWWIWLFYITIAFSLVYLALYPGLGMYGGLLGWSSTGQFREEMERAEAKYGPIYARFLAQDIRTVAADPEARAIGQRLFLNFCSQCHGSDAGGAKGIPNLRDRDWLWGGEPEAIRTSIAEGRTGVMPPLGAAVGGDEGAKDVAHYVFSLSGRTHDTLRAFRGKPRFAAVCAACHGPDGKGNPQLGAPNLTDSIWLHGGSEAAVIEAVMKGRKNEMPAHKLFLDEAKIHLLTAYVYGLSADLERK
ncbi:MAG: cytochrome-c oxidase, cbb3-type subunit III [Betaproteobacteria bacterium]|nr:cytochrome-c oxidase, cbb3-type subunit III [Betaproteobacteria bacterium]